MEANAKADRPVDTDIPEEASNDKQEVIHAVQSTFKTLFTWRYEQGEKSPLQSLYKKAKLAQWDSEFDIDWSIGGQIDRARDPADELSGLILFSGGPLGRLNAKERADFGHASLAWTISQFLHAEQGAMACAAKLVQSVPWVDAKYFAATQVMDEARHMEVYARYLHEKLEWKFPVNASLKSLLDDVINTSEWDFTFLGMQVVIEGLALAAFGFQYKHTRDPLLKQITRYLMADEARHVAFGVISLREMYEGMSAAELRRRQEFCYECAMRMCDRFLAKEVWETLGLPTRECVAMMRNDPAQIEYRKDLFSMVVPNVKRLGLLDAGDGWLRARFAELDVLKFEHLDDTGTGYGRMDLDHAPWSVTQHKHY